jgi:Rieske Fe-S protein
MPPPHGQQQFAAGQQQFTAGQQQSAAHPPVTEEHNADGASRRAVLTGTGIAVVAAGAGAAWYALAGPDPRPNAPSTGYAPPTQQGAAAAAPLSTVAAIPENGGVVLTDQAVVLTRESGDTVHAFSAVCTHQGCLVSNVANGVITCPCHGSTFDATTGSVLGGPAPSGLPAVPVTVTNGSVFRG